jgi:hypothetical protein
MKAIRLFALMVLALTAKVMMAQVHISPYVFEDPNVDGLPGTATSLIEGKLRAILSRNGINSNLGESRFILTAKFDVLEKEMTTTVPVKIISHLNVNFAIGDGIDGTCYGTKNVEITGVGETDEQAIINAVRNLDKKANVVSELIQRGVGRIIDYYRSNAGNILARGKGLMKSGNYDEAIFELSMIPQECQQYKEAQTLIGTAGRQRVNQNSAKILNEAQATWSANPTAANASNIITLLSQIDPSAACYQQAKALMNKIEARAKLEQDRAYQLVVKQMNNEAEMEKARLRSAERIAVAYAKSRPRVIYNTRIIRTWW